MLVGVCGGFGCMCGLGGLIRWAGDSLVRMSVLGTDGEAVASSLKS